MAKLLFFGRLGDGRADCELDLPDHVADTKSLVDWLAKDDPEFAELVRRPGHSIVVNQEIVRGATPVSNTDEVAFLSPVSGG